MPGVPDLRPQDPRPVLQGRGLQEGGGVAVWRCGWRIFWLAVRQASFGFTKLRDSQVWKLHSFLGASVSLVLEKLRHNFGIVTFSKQGSLDCKVLFLVIVASASAVGHLAMFYCVARVFRVGGPCQIQASWREGGNRQDLSYVRLCARQ